MTTDCVTSTLAYNYIGSSAGANLTTILGKINTALGASSINWISFNYHCLPSAPFSTAQGFAEAISTFVCTLQSEINTINADISSGVYTPTVFASSNLVTSTGAITLSPAKYMRVGNVVTVSGQISFTPMSAFLTQITLTLPIASANVANFSVCGAGTDYNNFLPVGIISIVSGGVTYAQFRWLANGTTVSALTYTYTYTLI